MSCCIGHSLSSSISKQKRDIQRSTSPVSRPDSQVHHSHASLKVPNRKICFSEPTAGFDSKDCTLTAVLRRA